MILEGEGGAPEQLEDVSLSEADQWGDLFAGESASSLLTSGPTCSAPNRVMVAVTACWYDQSIQPSGQIRDLLGT